MSTLSRTIKKTLRVSPRYFQISVSHFFAGIEFEQRQPPRSGLALMDGYCWNELDAYYKENTAPFDGLMIETEADEALNLSYREVYASLSLAQSSIARFDAALSQRVSVLLEQVKRVFEIEAG